MKKYYLLYLLTLFVYLAHAQKTNVIFILVDDMGYGDLGCYGQKLIETPNLDKLAENGLRFTQFYTGTSVCAPSRASLMTGLHTGHTPIRGNYEIQPEGQLPVPDATETLAELFKRAGYQTGGFGKWGLGFPSSEGDPVNQGFDTFYGYNCQRASHDYFPDHLWNNKERVVLKNNPGNQIQYAPDLIQQQAKEFINKNARKSFFLYLAYTLPHAALQIPSGDQLFEHYKHKFNEKPRPVNQQWNGKGYQPQAYPHAAYAAMVGKMDQYVGEVIDMLKKLGIERNTMVVFASDNGPHVEGGNDPAFFTSSGPFRGTKRQLTEGGIRTPLIVKWPEKIKTGKTIDEPGAFWDFFPTFSALTSQHVTNPTDGISLMPILLGHEQKQKHSFFYWEFHEDGGRQAVRMGKWKGIKENVMKNPHPVQLYNLDDDPGEKNDLANYHPEIVKEIQLIMDREHEENKTFPFSAKP